LAEHVFETFFTWVQNGPVGFEKKTQPAKKQYIHRIMVILCQVDFKEQIEKLTRLLPHTTKTCSRKDQAWVYFVPSQ